MTRAKIEELLTLAAKSKKADFLKAAEKLARVSRDAADVVWTCAKLLKNNKRLEKLGW